jgi:hypothetical protein
MKARTLFSRPGYWSHSLRLIAVEGTTEAEADAIAGRILGRKVTYMYPHKGARLYSRAVGRRAGEREHETLSNGIMRRYHWSA